MQIIQQASLTTADFNQQSRFIMQGFLPERMITLVYADGGNGKSWLALTLAKHALKQHKNVIYLDFDNPLNVLKNRGIDKNLIENNANLYYVQRSKSPLPANELVKTMQQQATAGSLDDTLIIFDSLRNFANVQNDGQINEMLTHMTNLREAGATVIILHHSNKDGKNYQGSNHIRNTVDNMYQLTKVMQRDNQLTLHCKVQKERTNIKDHAFIIDSRDLSYQLTNPDHVIVSDEEKNFIERAKLALSSGLSLNKTELLKACGKEKGDKTARYWLDKNQDLHWQINKKSNIITYQLMGATTSTTSTTSH